MNREEDGKKTLKSIIFNTIAVVISMIVSLITTVLLTRFISLSDLGIATSFITLKSIFTIICLLAIYISINRMLLDVGKNAFQYLSSIYIFSSFFCILLYLIYLIFNKYIYIITGFDFKFISLMFSMIFFINGCTLLVAYWTYNNNYKLNFLYSILCNPVSQIISLLLCMFLSGHKYLGRIIGIDIFNIIFGICCGIYILHKGKFSFKTDYVKKALKICLPMIPHLLAQLLLSSCDLLMIKNMVGSSQAGIYSMAYTISNLLYAVLIQLFNPWSPWVYRRMKKNEINSIYNNSKILISFCFYLCVALICISPELIKIFLSSNYYPSINLIPPICVGIFFQIMYIFFYDIEYFYKKNKLIAFFSVVTSILNIILNYFGIKYFGYQSAAYTTLISYLILLLLHYFGMRSVDKRKIYDINYLIKVSSILLFIFLIVMLYQNILLRYSLLIIISIYILVKYKDIILKIVKKRGVINDTETYDR